MSGSLLQKLLNLESNSRSAEDDQCNKQYSPRICFFKFTHIVRKVIEQQKMQRRVEKMTHLHFEHVK